jgi:hypothetical protein
LGFARGTALELNVCGGTPVIRETDYSPLAAECECEVITTIDFDGGALAVVGWSRSCSLDQPIMEARMPRRPHARRFDPFYPISDSRLTAEAEHVRREFENYARLALGTQSGSRNRVETCRAIRTLQEHLATSCLLLQSIQGRDQRIVQTLMFRDLWYVLQLYKKHLAPSGNNRNRLIAHRNQLRHNR